MKRIVGIFLAVAFCSSIFVAASFAAEKFAYVDLAKIFNDYNKRKDYEKTILDKENSYNTEREKKVNELKALNDKLSMLSDKEKTAKQQDMQIKIDALKEFDRQKVTDLRKENDEKMTEIFKDIQEAVKQVAEKESDTFVFSSQSLIYQDKKYEVTDSVVEILNKNYKK